MCWSARVSFATYAFSLGVGLYLGLGSPLYWNFIHMQLFEGLMWLDQGCDKGANRAATWLSVLLVCLQPLAAYGSCVLNHGMPYDGWALAAYLAAAPLLVVRCLQELRANGSDSACTRPPADGSSRHLSWGFLPPPTDPAIWAYMIMFLGPYLYCLATAFTWHNAIGTLGMVAIISAAAAYGRENGTWGTMWCFWANATALWLLGTHMARHTR